MYSFGVLVLAAVFGAADGQTPADTANLEKATLDYRRTIQRGQMIFTQKTYIKGMARPDRARITSVWFDGRYIRNDTTLRYKSDEPPHRQTSCRDCEFDGYYVNYDSYQTEAVRPALFLERLDANPNLDRYNAFDPRLLGMVVESSPNLATSRGRLDAFVGASDGLDVTGHDDLWEGVGCRRIDYHYQSGMKGRVWLVPGWGPSVARIETEGDAKGHHYLFSVQSEYGEFGAEKTRFPRVCVFTKRVDGEEEEREEATVQVISLNDPLEADSFKMAGMDIPAGTLVMGYRSDGPSTWNGKELVAEAPPDLPHAPPSAFAFPSWRLSDNWPYLVGAVVLALSGATAVRLYLAPRRQKPPTQK